jgi:hypothetical protein
LKNMVRTDHYFTERQALARSGGVMSIDIWVLFILFLMMQLNQGRVTEINLDKSSKHKPMGPCRAALQSSVYGRWCQSITVSAEFR